MGYALFVPEANDMVIRRQLFARMDSEGLLHSAMHAFEAPSVDDWLQQTSHEQGWLVCCQPDHMPYAAKNVGGMALFCPLQGRVWTFDFTAFRAHFKEAAAMCRAGLAWFFANAPCDSVLGFCAVRNKHAWALAYQAGFKILGRVPGACYRARHKRYEEAVLVQATRNNIRSFQ